MSYVTNIIISCDFCERKILDKHLREFTEKMELPPFIEFDNYRVGGNMNLESTMFVGAFNYFQSKEFVEFIHEIKDNLNTNCFSKRAFEYLQIFIKCEDDDWWTLKEASNLQESDFR